MSAKKLQQAMSQSVTSYLDSLGIEKPNNIYPLFMHEAEAALIRTIMEHTNHNQTETAAYLGLNRGTLRKKLKVHKLI